MAFWKKHVGRQIWYPWKEFICCTNSSNHSRARHHNIIIMQVNNTFTVNVLFFPSKANSWRLKNISCNRNEPKQYNNTWQIIEVSNSTKQHADNSGICHNTIYFLLITKNEVPFINNSEVTKRSRDRNENGKCTNATNCRSRVGLWTSFCFD